MCVCVYVHVYVRMNAHVYVRVSCTFEFVFVRAFAWCVRVSTYNTVYIDVPVHTCMYTICAHVPV